MDRTRKTSMISFRAENLLKKRLQEIALKNRRALSSVIIGILQDFLDSQEGNVTPGGIREERRHNPRKQVLLPARWRIREEENVLEHDVLLRSISVGGAYTEYVNGQNFQLIKNLQASPLTLAVRMPESQEPVVVECEVSRIHITDNSIGVGLRFIADSNDLITEPK